MKRSTSVLALMAGVIVAISCGPLGFQRPTSGAPPDVAEPSLFVGAAVSQLRHLWTEDEVGGGFSRADLAEGPSLYATAWNLRLTTAYKISVPNLDQAAVSQLLREVIARPTDPPHIAIDALPPLQRIYLATLALDDLGVPASADSVARAIGPFVIDGVYRYRAGDPPSWSATLAAVESLRLSGAQIPDGTRAAVRRALGRDTKTAADQSIVPTLLPLWQLADRLLLPDERKPLVPELSRMLARAIAILQSAGQLSGPSLAVAAAVREVAVANGIATAQLGVAFERLITRGGYLSLQEGRVLPDAQVTYYAAVLGMPKPEHFAETLVEGARSDGWRSVSSAPDPEASFHVLSLLHTVGDSSFDAALKVRTERWMAEIDDALLQSSAGRRRALHIALLGSELGLSHPTSAVNAYQAALTNPTGLGASEVLNVLRGAQLIGLAISPGARAAVAAELARLPQRSLRDVYIRAALGRLIGDERSFAQAAAAAAEFQDGPVYRYVRELPDLELRATCAGVWLRQGDGIAAAEHFTGRGGTWLLPPNVSTGNAMTTETLYVGFVLRGLVPGEALGGVPLCFF